MSTINTHQITRENINQRPSPFSNKSFPSTMVILGKSFSTAMNATTIGTGDKTLVLAHGFGGDQSLWDKIVPHLTNKYKVVIFDWSFAGALKDQNLFDPIKYSTYEGFADDLIHLLDEMMLTSIVFVGHSMSGMVGFDASIKRPDLFERLILLGASPRYINSEDYEGGFTSSDIDQLMTTVETNFIQWASFAANAFVDGKDPLSVEKFLKTLTSMSPDAAYVVAKLIFLGDHRQVLENVMVPCTFIQSTNDVTTPLSVPYYIQKNIKAESTVEVINGDGHFPHLTAHLEVLEIMGRVLGCDLISI